MISNGDYVCKHLRGALLINIKDNRYALYKPNGSLTSFNFFEDLQAESFQRNYVRITSNGRKIILIKLNLRTQNNCNEDLTTEQKEDHINNLIERYKIT